jgi:hypothetical protein
MSVTIHIQVQCTYCTVKVVPNIFNCVIIGYYLFLEDPKIQTAIEITSRMLSIGPSGQIRLTKILHFVCHAILFCRFLRIICNIISLYYDDTFFNPQNWNILEKIISSVKRNILQILERKATSFLKGQCHEIFRFWFFSWLSFPHAPDYTIRAVSIFFWKFTEIFAAQGLPPVLLTPVANGKNLQSEKF